MRLLRPWLVLVGLLLAAGITVAAPPVRAATRPRLVVVIVVDQLRRDYLERFEDLFLPPGRGGADAGGFRYLRERGAHFPSARYVHFPLFTGPGHAVVLTGGHPYRTGILGNDWYSVAERKTVYCVDDPGVRVVGAGPGSKARPMGPANLVSSTVGDELKLATGGGARVVTLSLKDRAAILLGGRLADGAVWFDEGSGAWISSTAYCREGRLPAWAAAVNDRRAPDAAFGKLWTTDLAPGDLRRAAKPALEGPLEAPYGLGPAFPHRVDGGLQAPGTAFYRAFALTPWANEWVLATAREAVAAERLGRDAIPDLMAVNLSTNDYVGHAFGPDSPEVIDITVRTDRQLAEWFRFLHRAVPGGLESVTLALTSDHGVAPVPEQMRARGFPAGRLLEGDLEKAAEAALDARFGAANWVLKYVEPYLYLNRPALAAARIEPEAAERVAARALARLDGVYASYPRTQIEEGRLPGTLLSAALYRAFHPRRAGDVLVLMEPFWFTEESPVRYGTTHGSPYPYDTEVPLLLAGAGIRPGVYREAAGPHDIAPSLCALLGIVSPSACDGRPLVAALR